MSKQSVIRESRPRPPRRWLDVDPEGQEPAEAGTQSDVTSPGPAGGLTPAIDADEGLRTYEVPSSFAAAIAAGVEGCPACSKEHAIERFEVEGTSYNACPNLPANAVLEVTTSGERFRAR